MRNSGIGDALDRAKFWDGVHAGDDPLYRADSSAQYVTRWLSKAGLVGYAGPCLEIGPGRGAHFRTLPRPRYAIDISPHNRARIAPDADGVFAPDDEPVALGCRSAFAFLVFQHCDEQAARTLMNWVRVAIQPGCAFHTQSAEWLEARDCTADDIIHGGGGVPRATFAAWLADAGFDPGAPHVENPNGGRAWCNWNIWRAVKR